MKAVSLHRTVGFFPLRRRQLYFTAAAAMGSSLCSSSYAFAPLRPPSPRLVLGSVRMEPAPRHPVLVSTRLYSSQGGDDGGFLDKVKDAAKSILPAKWFQSEDEKRAEIQRKQVRNEISGGIREVLKGAPLPIRMMGNLVAPLLSSMAETMGEQQRQVDDLLDDARMYMVRDPLVREALGEPVEVQSPFSQSSSTTSINGKTSSQTKASFYVQGAYQSGIAQMTATQDGISDLLVQVGGRTMRVNLSNSAGAFDKISDPYVSSQSTSLGKNPKNQNDVIDAEFVEKKDQK